MKRNRKKLYSILSGSKRTSCVMTLVVMTHVLMTFVVMLTGCSGSASQNEVEEQNQAENQTEDQAQIQEEDRGQNPDQILQEQGDSVSSIDYVSLYCDVDFWNPVEWSTEEHTITGDITKKTGLALAVTVPRQEADKKLSLMILNDEMPDIISVTDSTVISQLTSSGKVWRLREFLETYCPDSHILEDFPKDVKAELIKRDGDWYAYPSHINSADGAGTWEPSSQYYVDENTYNHNYVIMWNRKLLDRLGLTVDELHTEEQVLEAFEKAADSGLEVKRKSIIPLLVDGSSYAETTLGFLQSTFGAQYLDDEGKYRDIMLHPGTKEALRFLYTGLREAYIPAKSLTYSNDRIKEYIADGGGALLYRQCSKHQF